MIEGIFGAIDLVHLPLSICIKYLNFTVLNCWKRQCFNSQPKYTMFVPRYLRPKMIQREITNSKQYLKVVVFALCILLQRSTLRLLLDTVNLFLSAYIFMFNIYCLTSSPYNIIGYMFISKNRRNWKTAPVIDKLSG